MEWEDSEEVEEEDENNLPPFVWGRVEPLSEPTPSDVIAGVLGKLRKKCRSLCLGTESGPIKARGFEFEPNREVELSIETPAEQIIEEATPVEHPRAKIIEATMVRSSPLREQIISASIEPVFQTPLVTKSTPQSTA